MWFGAGGGQIWHTGGWKVGFTAQPNKHGPPHWQQSNSTAMELPFGTEFNSCQWGGPYSGNIWKTPPFGGSVAPLWETSMRNLEQICEVEKENACLLENAQAEGIEEWLERLLAPGHTTAGPPTFFQASHGLTQSCIHVQTEVIGLWAYWSQSFCCGPQGQAMRVFLETYLVAIRESATANCWLVISDAHCLQEEFWLPILLTVFRVNVPYPCLS